MSESATPETRARPCRAFQLPIVLLAEVSLKKLLYAFSMVVYVTRVGLRNNFFANIHFSRYCFAAYGDNSYQATTHIRRQVISGDNSYQFEKATTHIRRQLITGDNSYQFEKATTHIKRQLISIKTHIRKLKST